MTTGIPILNPLFSRNFGGLVLLCIEADFCDQGLIFQHFSRSTRSTFLRTFGAEMEKTMENHLVDPTEKAENAESSENVTNKRNQQCSTPNTRLTIFVQQCAANTRLTQKLRLLQRRQSEQHRFANFIKLQRVQVSGAGIFAECSRVYSGAKRPNKGYRNQQNFPKCREVSNPRIYG